jgi:hypothetical protein
MRYSSFIYKTVNDLLTTKDTARILTQLKEIYPKDTSRATAISSIRFHCLQDIRASSRVHEELKRAAILIDDTELTDMWIQPLESCTVYDIQQIQKKAYLHTYSYNVQVDTIVANMCIVPEFLKEFRAFIPRGTESQIDKDSSRVLEIHNPNDILKRIFHILVDESNARSISDTVLALCVATGRRTMEILATGIFEPIEEHEYMLLFSGQVKCNGQMKPYCIPCLFPSSIVIAAHRRIRTHCNIQSPVSATCQGDYVRHVLHQRFSSQFNKRCKKIFQEYITGKFHVHDLRGLYIILAFHMNKHTNITFPKFAQCALGHCSQHISLHYNRFRMHHIDELPVVDFCQFPFAPLSDSKQNIEGMHSEEKQDEDLSLI